MILVQYSIIGYPSFLTEHEPGSSLTFSIGRQLSFTGDQNLLTGPLHDMVTWYKITYTGEQVAQWNFQIKGRCIVFTVPLCNLLTSICNFVPCDPSPGCAKGLLGFFIGKTFCLMIKPRCKPFVLACSWSTYSMPVLNETLCVVL